MEEKLGPYGHGRGRGWGYHRSRAFRCAMKSMVKEHLSCLA